MINFEEVDTNFTYYYARVLFEENIHPQIIALLLFTDLTNLDASFVLKEFPLDLRKDVMRRIHQIKQYCSGDLINSLRNKMEDKVNTLISFYPKRISDLSEEESELCENIKKELDSYFKEDKLFN